MVLASEPVGVRSRATELPCSLCIKCAQWAGKAPPSITLLLSFGFQIIVPCVLNVHSKLVKRREVYLGCMMSSGCMKHKIYSLFLSQSVTVQNKNVLM